MLKSILVSGRKRRVLEDEDRAACSERLSRLERQCKRLEADQALLRSKLTVYPSQLRDATKNVAWMDAATRLVISPASRALLRSLYKVQVRFRSTGIGNVSGMCTFRPRDKNVTRGLFILIVLR